MWSKAICSNKKENKDQIGEAVELFKAVLQQDTTKEILKYMQDAEKARQHELELTELILSSTDSASPAERDHNQPNYFNMATHQCKVLITCIITFTISMYLDSIFQQQSRLAQS